VTTRSLLVDSGVFLYALGGRHPLKTSCRTALADEHIDLHASVEMVQEVVFHRMRVDSRDNALLQAQTVASTCRLHPFDQAVLAEALALISRHRIGGRDAVHAATALVAGIGEILSADSDFDGLPGLTRVDPREFV
jgi:predicted nucleic acid-binding protein